MLRGTSQTSHHDHARDSKELIRDTVGCAFSLGSLVTGGCALPATARAARVEVLADTRLRRDTFPYDPLSEPR